MPSMNIVYRKAVEMKATRLARGKSHVYQEGAPGHESDVRNKVAAIRKIICGDKAAIRSFGRKQSESVANSRN